MSEITLQMISKLLYPAVLPILELLADQVDQEIHGVQQILWDPEITFLYVQCQNVN